MTEICLLSNNIMDYHIVSQGKTTIPSVDDAEEMTFTDVRSQMLCHYLHDHLLFTTIR